MNETRSSGVVRRTRSQPSTSVIARPTDGAMPPELDDATVRTDAAPINETRCYGAATTVVALHDDAAMEHDAFRHHVRA